MRDYNIIEFETITSTNTYLKDNYKTLPEFTVVTSNIQTSGKGRMGRAWTSDTGNLYFSILIKNSINKIKQNNLSSITLIAGLSVLKVLNQYTKCMIKWPNDILVGKKKICGILSEAISDHHVKSLVIGVGINLNQTSFNEDIKDKAISLKSITNKDINKAQILSEILKVFDKEYTAFCKGNKEYIKQFNEFSYLNHKKVYIENEEVEIIEIEENGMLKVKGKKGTRLITSGEVTLENIYNN